MEYLFLLSFLTAALLFMAFHNPLSMCLALILAAMSVGGLAWWMSSKWLGLALIIIFVGGMMIAFLYVSSLALNQKLVQNLSKFSGLVPLVCLLYLAPPSPLLPKPTLFPESLFYALNGPLVCVLIIYLLLIMLVVVKVTESFKGSLVQRF